MWCLCLFLNAGSHLEELPTLLHCAAKFGLKKLATVLLQHPGAIRACKVTNKYGESPACVAEKHGQKEVQEIIKELSVSICTSSARAI